MANNRKNALHITTVHARTDTRIFSKETISLAKSGWNVEAAVFDGLGDENGDLIKIWDLGKPPKSRIMRFILGSIKTLVYVSKNDHSVVHFHDPELIPILYFAPISNSKIIYDIHELVTADIHTKHWIPRKSRRFVSSFFFAIESIFTSSFQYIYAEDSYIKHHKRPFPTIRNFPDLRILSRIFTKTKRETFTTCYLGAVSPNRGSSRYAEAIASLRKEGLKIKLLIIGPLNTEVEQNRYFKEGLKEGWIETTGRLPPLDAWKEISTAHLGLSVLDDEANFRTSYPTKLFEYMALGLPSICSDFPLYSKVVETNKVGIAVNPNSKTEIADAIRTYYSNRNLLETHQHNAVNAVSSQFNWSNEETKLIRLYNKIETEFHNIALV